MLWRATIVVLALSIYLLTLLSPLARASSGIDWVFMVYMSGDNDLEPQALMDLEELEQVGSSDRVVFVVYIDRSPKNYESAEYLPDLSAYGEWDDSRVYLVKKHPEPGIGSEILSQPGEVNSGDPQVLADFVAYVHMKFKAKHYALILWNHGSGVDVAVDETDRDVITLDELREVLDALARAGIHIDLVGFDACLMSTVESMYAVADYVDYIVASIENEPNPGWYYTPIALELVRNPSMSPEELAKIIVRSYQDFYEKEGYNAATLAAFSLQEVSSKEIEEAVKSLADFASKNPQVVRNVREQVQEHGVQEGIGGVTVDYIQLINLLEQKGLSGKAVDFARKLEVARVVSYAGEAFRGSSGVGIFFPRVNLNKFYTSVSSLPKITGWDKALLKIVDISPEISQQPVVEAEVQAGIPGGEGGVGGGAETYGFLASAGHFDVDGRPGEEVMVIVNTYTDKGMASQLIVVSLEGSSLKTVTNKIIDVGSNEGDELYTITTLEADVDNDGKSELVVLDQLYVDGMIPQARVLVVEPVNGKVLDYVSIDEFAVGGGGVGDVNGDGKPELVVVGTAYNIGEYGYVESSKAQVFVASLPSLELLDQFSLGSRRAVFIEGSSLALADINGDGVDEMFISTIKYDDQYNHLSDLDEVVIIGYRGGDKEVLGSIKASVYDMDAGDVDGDGLPELILASVLSPKIAIVKVAGRDAGKVLAEIDFSNTKYDYAGGVSIFDLDGDKVNEVVIILVDVDEYGYPQEAGMRVISVAGQVKLEYSADDLLYGDNIRIPMAVDMNGDNKPEMVYIALDAGIISLSLHEIENYVETTGGVQGVVLGENNEPISGAKVIIHVPRQEAAYYTKTGPDGSFRFDNVPASTYELIVIHGEQVAYMDIVVRPGEYTNVTVRLGSQEAASSEQGQSEEAQTTTTQQQETTTTTTTSTPTPQPSTTTTTTTLQHSETTQAHTENGQGQQTITTTTTTTVTVVTTTATSEGEQTETSTTSTPQATQTSTQQVTSREEEATTPEPQLNISIPPIQIVNTTSTPSKTTTSLTTQSTTQTKTLKTSLLQTQGEGKATSTPLYFYVAPGIIIGLAIAYVALKKKSTSPPWPPPPPPT